MTKRELKDIINECISERESNNYIDYNSINEDTNIVLVEDYEEEVLIESLRTILEFCKNNNDYEYILENYEYINEGKNLDNATNCHKTLKEVNEYIKEAKQYIQDGESSKAKSTIDKAIKKLQQLKKEVNDNNSTGAAFWGAIATSILNSITMGGFNLAKVIYSIYMTHSVKSGVSRKPALAANIANAIPGTASAIISKIKNGDGIWWSMLKGLNIAANITSIAKFIDDIYTIDKARKETGNGGSTFYNNITTDIFKIIDEYITILNKLKANIK